MSKRKQEEEIKVPVYVHPFVDHPLFCNLTIDTLDKKEIRTDRTFLAKQSSVLQDVLCMESDHPDRLSLPYAYSILTSALWFLNDIGDPRVDDKDRDFEEYWYKITDVNMWIEVMKFAIGYKTENLIRVCSHALNPEEREGYSVEDVCKIWKFSQSCGEAKSLASGCATYLREHSKDAWKELVKDLSQDNKTLLKLSLQEVYDQARDFRLLQGLWQECQGSEYRKQDHIRECLTKLSLRGKKRIRDILNGPNHYETFTRMSLLNLTEENSDTLLLWVQ